LGGGRNSNSEKEMDMITSSKVSMPKSKGEFGLWNTEATNKAFQYKLA